LKKPISTGRAWLTSDYLAGNICHSAFSVFHIVIILYQDFPFRMIQNHLNTMALNNAGRGLRYTGYVSTEIQFRGHFPEQKQPEKDLPPETKSTPSEVVMTQQSPEFAPKPEQSIWQKTQHGAGVVWNGTKRFFKKVSRPKVLKESVVQGAKEVKHVWKKDFCDATAAGKAKHLGWEGLGLTVAAAFFWFPGPSPAIFISPSCRSFALGFWKDTPTEKEKEKAKSEQAALGTPASDPSASEKAP
jgi:hypothetical protein